MPWVRYEDDTKTFMGEMRLFFVEGSDDLVVTFRQATGDVTKIINSDLVPSDFQLNHTVRLQDLDMKALVRTLLPGSRIDPKWHVLHLKNRLDNASLTKIQIPVVPEKR